MISEDKINSVLTENSDKIFFYALRHTGNESEAEDLAQDIMLAILSSYKNLRNDDALYGFIWRVAQNQCRLWARKKSRSAATVSLDETETEIADEPEEEENPAVGKLRKELSLCSATYRNLLIGFYKYGKSCDELAKEFHTSEGNVKFMLFKARKKIKEGMQMERILGERSYEPQNIAVLYFGSGDNIYYQLCRKKIVQNILMACYNDVCTLQDISLQIGCAVPYIEDEIAPLIDSGLLIRPSRDKYSTNIIVLTSLFERDLKNLIGDEYEKMGDMIASFASAHEKEIRSLGFIGSDMDEGAFLWHIALISLKKLAEDFRKTKYEKDIVFGVEDYNPEFEAALCTMYALDGSLLQFIDVISEESKFPPHSWIYKNDAGVNLLMDIARDGKKKLGDIEKIVLKNISPFVRERDGAYLPSMPAYTKEQWTQLENIASPLTDEMKASFDRIFDKCLWLLGSHTPKALKEQIPSVASIYMGGNIFGNVLGSMHSRGLLAFAHSDFVPTAYIILK